MEERRGSFALIRDDADNRDGYPRADWFSEFEIEPAGLRILRHSSETSPQEWEHVSFTNIRGATDTAGLALDIATGIPEGTHHRAIVDINPHVARVHAAGNMGVGLYHPSAPQTRAKYS